jgi:hypothetical protein
MTWNRLRTCRSLFPRRTGKPIGNRQVRRLWLEALEDRTLLSVVHWTGPSGDWAVAANWTDDQGAHRLPGSADDAVINTAGITVTHSSGADSIKSLTIGSGTLTLSGGTLSISAAFSNAGTFRKTDTSTDGFGTFSNSGTVEVQAGTLSLSGGTSGGSFTVDAEATMNLNNYTLLAGSSVTGTGSVGLSGSATVNGTYNLTGSGGTTVTGSGTSVDFTTSSTVGGLGGFLNVPAFSAGVTFDVPVGGVDGPLAVTGGFDTLTFTKTVGRVGGAITTFGVVNFLGVVNFTGSAITINNNALNFSGGSVISTNALTITGGALTGRDPVTVTGLMDWTGAR